MNPHQQITTLDNDGTAYVLARLDVQVGQNLMEFVEYEVLSLDHEWIELKPNCMKVKTGPRNGVLFTPDELDRSSGRHAVWFRWATLGPIEIRIQ